jgi:hypothetical protein
MNIYGESRTFTPTLSPWGRERKSAAQAYEY